MKTIDKLAQKYALNINKIRGPSEAKSLDFKNLNKGFYDDIEKNDIVIKQNQKELKRIKKISLKEFVYTNIEIPDKWKKKSNYENDLLNLMIRDNNILTYVGASPKQENITDKSYNEKKVTKKKTNSYDNKKNFPSINNRYEKKAIEKSFSKDNESIKFNNIFEPEFIHKKTITEEYNNDNSGPKINKIKKKLQSKAELNNKAINNILEDFKTSYPIKENLQKLYTNTNYYNVKNNNLIKNNIEDKNIKELSSEILCKKLNTIFHNKYNNIVSNEKNYFFNSIKKQQQFKRKNIFRQNIFNNLVSNNTYSVDRKNEIKQILAKDLNQNKRPSLGSDYQSFIKKTKINNAIINKNLESINYYGPYFSHCPPCYNRNMNYYKNLEINQCIYIIHHIKKNRKKSIIEY